MKLLNLYLQLKIQVCLSNCLLVISTWPCNENLNSFLFKPKLMISPDKTAAPVVFLFTVNGNSWPSSCSGQNFGVSLTSLLYIPYPINQWYWWFFQNTFTFNYFLLSLLPAPTLDHCISHQIINTVFSLAFLHPQLFPRSLFLTARVFLLKLELNRSLIYSTPPISSPFIQSKKLWSLQWPTKTK